MRFTTNRGGHRFASPCTPPLSCPIAALQYESVLVKPLFSL
jgi:hypothetical protein